MALVAFNAMRQYAVLQQVPFELDVRKARVPHPAFYELPAGVPFLQNYYDQVAAVVKGPKPNQLDVPPEVYYPLYEHYVHLSANYNRALLTHLRGAGFNFYANEPSLNTFRRPAVAAQATADKRRVYLLPRGATAPPPVTKVSGAPSPTTVAARKVAAAEQTHQYAQDERDWATLTAHPLAGAYELTFRTFLPFDYVTEPVAADPAFYNVAFLDEANVRTYPQYNDQAHGGHKSQQRFVLDFAAGTAYYVGETPPDTFAKKVAGSGDPSQGLVTRYANKGLGDAGSGVLAGYTHFAGATDIAKPGAFSVYAIISTANPAFPLPTPSIDYRLNLSVDAYGDFELTGTWDGFPALEIFVKDLRTGAVSLLYADLPRDAGTTHSPADIYNLLDSRGDVYLHQRGNFKRLPAQHDRIQPPAQLKRIHEIFGQP